MRGELGVGWGGGAKIGATFLHVFTAILLLMGLVKTFNDRNLSRNQFFLFCKIMYILKVEMRHNQASTVFLGHFVVLSYFLL
jgi:hypothetical protein